MKIKKLEAKIEIPKDVQVEIDKNIIRIKGPKGEIEKKIMIPGLSLSKQDSKIILSSESISKRGKRIINSHRAHLRNVISGLINPYIYQLKVCSTHFPISVSVEKDKVIIKNFFGEKTPRKAKIIKNSTVKVAGDVITVESIDKETAGQTAANIEQATRITNRDKRVFSDGCYIFVKANESLGKK